MHKDVLIGTSAHVYPDICTHTDWRTRAQPIFTLQSPTRQPIQPLTKLFVVCLGFVFCLFFVCGGVVDLKLVRFSFSFIIDEV